jgi:YidC/Oxa1 family membrane protein insertase
MNKRFSKTTYLFIALFTLVTLSGCAVEKDGVTLPIGTGIWDSVFVRPVGWLMNFLTQHPLVGSFGVGIILTTIILRTILFPIYTKTNDTSTKMQSVQPLIKKVQEKYAGKTDPESKQKMQVELMAVYKDNNVNMLAGCLMPFLQMPIFMAMFHAVRRVPYSYDGYTEEVTTFLWINLAQRNIFLPILVAITAIILQYITMYGLSAEAKNNPTMKVMLYMMPAMMFVFSIMQVSSLSLYWVAGNIYSTLQIIYVKKPFKKKL